MPLQVNVGAPQRILGMATGRVGVGWSFRGPVPETREENPTRTRTLLRVKMFIQPQTRREPNDGEPETRACYRCNKYVNIVQTQNTVLSFSSQNYGPA